ncbi:MAG: DUF2300 domain-containing protein [Magnetococcales bacterium]|nr:DUF2300 domain-containing protein [Magnetococcales bacterium]
MKIYWGTFWSMVSAVVASAVLAGCFFWMMAVTAADDVHPHCGRDFRAEAWLAFREGVWGRHLAQYPGYEPPGPLEVCQEAAGNPHVVNNLGKGQIHLPYLHDAEKRLSLAHEYLHWAFRHHPVARNEIWIEDMARVLALGEEER